MKDSTVSAISTPIGRGGIAVIRISGSEALSVADRMFRPKNGKPISEVTGGRAVYGDILYEGRVIDDGIASVFRAPHSFTGEDTVEISCHGGIFITGKVLESSFLCGAEPAGAGEFTKRAFMSGHIGLSQAEAVMDLIDAKSESQLALASSQSRGSLSGRVKQLYDRLTALVAKIYVDIDYPGEELASFEEGELEGELSALISDIEKLASTYKTGHAVAEGIPVVIAGKPNTGKSSLLNMLLMRERAIVTDEAGTTRDVIEETMQVGCVMLRLFDTAGIREADNKAEQIGVERTLEKIEEAELVLAVFDLSAPLGDEDMRFISELERYKKNGGTVLVVLNKSDLPSDETIISYDFSHLGQTVTISAAEGDGRERLTERIEALYIDGDIDLSEDAIVSNARQYASLMRAFEHLSDALREIEDGLTEDIAGTDMELALSALGQLDGRSVTDDIVHGIFSRFCVGK